MTDIGFILPAQRSRERLGRQRGPSASLQAILTYGAFCTSIVFSFALVLGVIH